MLSALLVEEGSNYRNSKVSLKFSDWPANCVTKRKAVMP